MWVELLLVACLGAILSLDDRAFFQGMLAHPLVAGTATGLLVGDAALGFEIGLVVGLFWSYALPVGGVVPPSGLVVAVTATALAGWLGAEPWVRAIGLLWAMPFGVLAARFELGARTWNLALARRCDTVPVGELDGALWTVQGVGLFGAIFFQGAGVLLALLSGWMVLPWLVDVSPGVIREAFFWLYAILPFLGMGAVVLALRVRRSFFILGVVFGGVLLVATW